MTMTIQTVKNNGPRKRSCGATAKPARQTTTNHAQPTRLATPNAQSVCQRQLTTVLAKVDVGFGNALFIRGQGDGLSWEKGTPLECVAPSTWIWATDKASQPLVFKLLLNDQLWSQGDDWTVPLGESLEVAPVF
jgi:hypothetical protein